MVEELWLSVTQLPSPPHLSPSQDGERGQSSEGKGDSLPRTSWDLGPGAEGQRWWDPTPWFCAVWGIRCVMGSLADSLGKLLFSWVPPTSPACLLPALLGLPSESLS